jgi:hypothetical protein
MVLAISIAIPIRIKKERKKKRKKKRKGVIFVCHSTRLGKSQIRQKLQQNCPHHCYPGARTDLMGMMSAGQMLRHKVH